MSPTTAAPIPSVRLPSVFSDSRPLPTLFVFDLDYTLWPLWVDTHVSGTLKPSPSGLTVTDRYGEEYGFYADVAGLLAHIRDAGCQIGAASRTSAPERAREMLRGLKVAGRSAIDSFDVLEIYPGDKRTHFERIKKKTGVEFADMLFFDDESRNKNVEQLGVTMRLVRDGVTVQEVERGVEEWRKRNGRQKE
ncbi:hypothetical protein ANO11243_059100 [Dothideomycetidae sp. 11243]|nr:hypothetical protein ANO11243_059100 [fungal sp. No.11243]